MFLFESLAFWQYFLIVLILVSFLVYLIVDSKKKKSGHPFKYNLYCMIPMLLALLVNRYVNEFAQNAILLKITNGIVCVLIGVLFVTLCVSTYLSYKKGYMTNHGKMIVRNVVIPSAVVFVLCVVALLCIEFFW